MSRLVVAIGMTHEPGLPLGEVDPFLETKVEVE